MIKLAADKVCTGCMACSDVCNVDAISLALKNNHYYPSVDSTKCVECGRCMRACPILTPVQKNEVVGMHAFGGWAKDVQMRHNGASGGAFAAFATSFCRMHEGEVAIYGAALRDDNRVEHQRISSAGEIPLLMNSKYIQSITQGIYRKVLEDIRQGLWVMFSGTPCQIAGLYGFLGNKRDYEKLVTVELVCHGVPGFEALDIHLEYSKSPRILSFRNKEKGQYWYVSQCTTVERDGKPYTFKRKDDVFYSIFSGWLLDRLSCSNCQYSSLNRVADITLADFWGGAPCEADYKEGVSLIIANNCKADGCVRSSSDLYVYESTLKKAVSSNSNMYNGLKYIQYHPLVMFPNFFRKILPRKLWIAIVINHMPWRLFWAVFKVLTILHIKRRRKETLKYIDSL